MIGQVRISTRPIYLYIASWSENREINILPVETKFIIEEEGLTPWSNVHVYQEAADYIQIIFENGHHALIHRLEMLNKSREI